MPKPQRKGKKLLPKPGLVHKAAWMTASRVLGMASGAAGAVWVARCLGPKNLGLSGMVQNLVFQAAVLFAALSPTLLVREYKHSPDEGARNRLIRTTYGFRLLTAVGLCLAAVPILVLHLVPPDYQRVGWLFLPNLLLLSLQPAWIFQAAEKQQFQSLLALFQPLLTALFYFGLIRPGMSAGADLLVITAVTTVVTTAYWVAVYRLTPFQGSFCSFQNLGEAWALAVKSRWLFLSMLAIYVYTLLEQPFLGWLRPIEELGRYRTAVRVTDAVNATLTLIPVLLFPRFIEWRKEGEKVLWKHQGRLLGLFGIGGAAAAALGFLVIPACYPFVFGPGFESAGLPCVLLVTSKIVVLVSGVYGWGLLTDHCFDHKVCLATVATAVFSLGCNLFLIPRFGMMGASLTNLASELLILGLFLWLSVARYRKVSSKGRA